MIPNEEKDEEESAMKKLTVWVVLLVCLFVGGIAMAEQDHAFQH